METINHEYYVSLEVAKLLAEVGFDWKCKTYYDTSLYRDEIIIEDELRDYNFMNGSIIFSAPTLDVAQKWLREVKGIEFDLCWHMTLDNQYKYAYAIKIKSIWKGLDKGKEIEVPSMDCLEAETCFNTFEEAQEAGIKKALEFILHKE